MAFGPIEILCIKFPETAISEDIATALKELVNSRTIRIVDILFVLKQDNGDITMIEIDEMDHVDHSFLDPLVANIAGLISAEDVQVVANGLDNNSFAVIMLFENIWATSFRDAVLKADGQLLLNERIPSRVVDGALAAQATS